MIKVIKSIIDYNLVSPNLYNKVSETKVLFRDFPSDHAPIIVKIKLDDKITKQIAPTIPKFIYKKANWQLFKSEINSQISRADWTK